MGFEAPVDILNVAALGGWATKVFFVLLAAFIIPNENKVLPKTA